MSLGGIHLPKDPLERFCALYGELLAQRSWLESGDSLRFSALVLTPIPGEPKRIAARLLETSEELRRATPWYGSLRSSLRFLFAALLVRYDDRVGDYLAEVERAGKLFRERWKLSGNVHESLAILVLRQRSPEGRVGAAEVARLDEIWREMKRLHPWITHKSDWPACALLASTPAPPAQIAERLEAMYGGLRERGYTRGEALQTAAHILFFHLEPPHVVCARFERLFGSFKQAGLWMGQEDFDEIALLCFTSQPEAEVVERVRAHRERIAELKPRPGKQTSFSLACGTALLQLLRRSTDLAVLTEAQALLQIQAILQAQQAAVAAAAAVSAGAASAG